MRVLLVEDDPDLRHIVRTALQLSHLAVDTAASVAEAVDRLVVTRYDLVCLDLTLPDGDGLELGRRLGSDPALQTPHRVLILTARDAVAQRVEGLDAGADDYLVKPFALEELMARIRALMRRHDQRGESIRIEDLDIDVIRFRARRASRDLALTGKEFAVLRYLAWRHAEVVSAEQLLEHCWDAEVDTFTSSTRVIMSRLRKKLGDPPLIHTVTGVGYRLGTPE